tara:strand:- start:383 stop:646 length:264 start_codon:yes stop_codon:yes gene_type:complete
MKILELDLKIESKLISKIANHRIMIRETFKKRHKGAFPEVNKSQCMYHVNELRIWLRMAQVIDKGKNWGWENPTKSYEAYYAEELTK